jgi:hypothetical protein
MITRGLAIAAALALSVITTGCLSRIQRETARQNAAGAEQYKTTMANLGKPAFASVPVTRVAAEDAPRPAAGGSWHCYEFDVARKGSGEAGASSCLPSRADCNQERRSRERTSSAFNVSHCLPSKTTSCFAHWNEGKKSEAEFNCYADAEECARRVPRESMAPMSASGCFAP